MATVNINYEEREGGQVATVAINRPEKMNALESLLSKFDLKEMVRTGKVVMARGNEIT